MYLLFFGQNRINVNTLTVHWKRTKSICCWSSLNINKIEEKNEIFFPKFEICWYFSDSREQFRLAGEVELMSNALNPRAKNGVLGKQTKESILKQQWSNLSTNAREPFD